MSITALTASSTPSFVTPTKPGTTSAGNFEQALQTATPQDTNPTSLLDTDIFGRKFTGAPHPISIEEIGQFAAKASSEARSALDALFASNGIPASPPVQLSSDTQGRIIASGSPHQARIQALLDQNPDITDKIGKSLNFESMHADLKSYEVFMQHYESAYKAGGSKASSALLERYASRPQPDYSLSYGLSGMELRINGQNLLSWLEQTDRFLTLA